MKVIPHIIDQHAEEAAFLWLLRSAAVNAPHYSLSDLVDLDERVEAHLDGLDVAGDEGWQVCAENLKFKEAGEVFAASVIALRGGRKDRIEKIYSIVETQPALLPGLISALGWVNGSKLQWVVKTLLKSRCSLWRAVGIDACRVQRADLGRFLNSGLNDEDVEVQISAARTAGELARQDLKSDLNKLLKSQSKDVVFWVARSLVLLGDNTNSLRYLTRLALGENVYQSQAMDIVLRVSDTPTAQNILKALSTNDNKLRDCISGIGIYGDPVYVPWLISQFANPGLSRKAGESFSMITGIDLAYDDLETDQPEGFEAGPDDDLESVNVAMDDDEDLPWPNSVLILQWWENNKTKFTVGQRYFMGQLIKDVNLNETLRSGTQRQRSAAALELALMSPIGMLFETQANAKQQKAMLG